MTANAEVVEQAGDTVARIDAQISKLRSERERASADQRRAAEHLARATAEGEPESERKRLRTDGRAATDKVVELDGAIALLDGELVSAREAEREATIRDADKAAALAATGYVTAFLDAEAVQMQCLRAFVPAFDQAMVAYARAREAHATAVRARGERAQDFPLDERPELHALPMARTQAFFHLARKVARAGGSTYVGQSANRCHECGQERE